MNISQESDYAIRAIRAMYNYGIDNRIEAKYISDKENIPIRFLFKILRKLCNKNIVKSYRGVNGGYVLNSSLKDISLKDIVEAIEGPVYISKCTKDPKTCEFSSLGCNIHREMLRVEREILKVISRKSLEEIFKG